MGNFGDGDNSKRGKSRGSAKVASALDGLGSVSRGSGGADWGAADVKHIHAIITHLTARGGMASFGLSRDKGAYSVTILLDGDRRVIWISSTEDVDAKLEEIAVFLDALPL